MNFEPGEEDHPPQHSWQWVVFGLGLVATYVLVTLLSSW